MQGVFNPNILIYHPPNSTEGLHFSAFHFTRNEVGFFPYLYCVYALVGGAISIRDPYICAVSRVCANESHAVFHGPVVCAVKT